MYIQIKYVFIWSLRDSRHFRVDRWTEGTVVEGFILDNGFPELYLPSWERGGHSLRLLQDKGSYMM